MKNAILILGLLLLAALPLAAQTSAIPCGTNIVGVELPTVPEITSGDSGVLKGTLFTVSEQVRMPAGGPGSSPVCHPQWVRAYRKDAPASWNPPSSLITDPMPGPTLRAKVGDVVNLSFFNFIDANKFPNSDQGCDKTNVYPGTTGDKYPDCFADSVFTNVHYHGTHTSPNTTADNVFINVRPSPRTPGSNDPVVMVKDVQPDFDRFFEQCNKQLQPATGPKMWPLKWSDLFPADEALQKRLLKYVKDYGLPGWFDSNEKLIANGFWPQYFVGAYPYCFKLPKLTGTAPGTTSPDVTTAHSHGAGSAEVAEAASPERPLIMGQAPGTHWYHAHKHGSTTVNVMNGMTGVFVIEGDYDKTIRDYYGKNFVEKVMVVQQLGSVPNLVTNARGDVNFFVNGKLKPVVKMAGNSVQMWRVANTAGRAGAYFAAPTGLQWKQLAVDGVQLTPDNYWNRRSNFLLMSGNRVDLLVKAPPFNATDPSKNKIDVIVYNTIDPTEVPPINPTAAALTLLTVEVTANGADMQFIPKDQAPKQPDFLKDITDEEVTGTKILKFATSKVDPNQPRATPAKHTIDGKLFDGELGAVVELNRAEEWKIVNESYGGTAISHPFHIHINPFQLTEIFEPNAYIPSGTPGGTVSVTTGSAAVTGVGTAFTTDFRAGDVISINTGQGGVVASIADNTHLTLSGNATATLSGAGYSMMIPQYTIDKAGARAGQCYLDPDKPKTWVPCGPGEPEKERIWWDVFPIPSGKVFTSGTRSQSIPGYFKMRSRFVDYSGYFVLHCHILAHEDRGMMTVVGVAPIQTPYSHH